MPGTECWLSVLWVTVVVVCGGTTVTVQVSTSSQFEGVKVPGTECWLSVWCVTVVVVCGVTTSTVQVGTLPQSLGV